MKKTEEDRGLKIAMITLMLSLHSRAMVIFMSILTFLAMVAFIMSVGEKSNKLANLEATLAGDYDRLT